MRNVPLILVVEDNPASLEIMQVRLEANKYEVITATDGVDGLAKAEEHLPDLILLDIMMPEMDGLEVCRRIKNNPEMPFIPIIMVTAKTDTEDIITGLNAGGDEYLTKPVDHGSLIARVKSMLRIKDLHDTVIDQSVQLEHQLVTASKIQTLFWPDLPGVTEGLNIWAESHPASYVGGDLYDVIRLPDGSVITYVADVSGKGVPAALIMAALATRIRAEAFLHDDIDHLLRSVNRSLYRLISDEGYFVTMILVRYWNREQKVQLIRAGHPNPILVTRDGTDMITNLQGVSLGFMDDVVYEATEIVLGSGDSLFLYSDGVTEAENENKELFGDDRLIAYLQTAETRPRGAGLKDVIEQWRGGATANDDLTVLEIWSHE